MLGATTDKATNLEESRVPPTYTMFGERALSVAGPSVWNSLPADIRNITDIYLYFQESSQDSPFYSARQ